MSRSGLAAGLQGHSDHLGALSAAAAATVIAAGPGSAAAPVGLSPRRSVPLSLPSPPVLLRRSLQRLYSGPQRSRPAVDNAADPCFTMLSVA